MRHSLNIYYLYNKKHKVVNLKLNFKKRCWAQIDLDALEFNMKLIMKKLDKNEKIMAVVKADAYGCGAKSVANFLQKRFQIKHWAVASLEEATDLRKARIKGEILVLGYTPTNLANLLSFNKISQSVYCREYALALSKELEKLNKNILIHLVVDTGMNRIGFLPSGDLSQYENLPGFKLNGIYTHLCCADSLSKADQVFTLDQIRKFSEVAKNFKNPHCKNSAAILRGVGNGFSYARPGIILYGLKPSSQVKCDALRPVMSFKTVVSMVKTVKKGEFVGYGRNFCAKSEKKIATIPVGYADGYPRFLSNKGKVLINGKIATVAGNICMDQTMLDVTNLDVRPEDVVTLFGSDGKNSITADDIADSIGTIGYEVVCGISKRVPRIYSYRSKEIDPISDDIL